MMTRKFSTLAAVSALALMTACSTAPERRTVGEAPVRMDSQSAMYGQVRNIQLVSTAGRSGTGGAVLGAVIGGVIGNQIGSGTGRAAATGIGAVGGAVAGNELAKRNADDVYRVEVRFEDGSIRTFDYESVGDLRPGDRVRWENGQLYRV